MKKKLQSVFSLAMAMGTLFLTACGTQGDDTQSPAVETPAYNITSTDIDLVQDGRTEYKLVYPYGDNTDLMNFARSEMSYFFEQATGITLEELADNTVDLTYTDNVKYISLGETKLLEQAGLSQGIDRQELKQTGYTILNKGNSVFLCGGQVNGTVNAVYRFLREQFNFECYASDEIVLDTGVRNEKLLNYDGLKDIPDITFHAAAQCELLNDVVYARRLGMSTQSDWILELGESYYHNFFGTISPDEYAKENPLWFSPNMKQLCLTRDRDGLAAEVVEKMKVVVENSDTAYAIGFTQMDDNGWCECETCKQCAVKYGADSAAQILFMNKCWELLEPWLEAQRAQGKLNREIYLYMFAYQSTTDAPTNTNENGEIYPEMRLNEHIYVQYAPIYAAGYHSYGHVSQSNTDNSSFDITMNNWLKLTDNIMFWSYSYYYKNKLWPYYDFSNMQETFAYVANHGVDYLFDEDHAGVGGAWTDWARLKYYLRQKLAWDTDADLEYYKEQWFVNYFKGASDTMQQLFDEYSTHFTKLIAENDLRGQGAKLDINNIEYWPKGLLDRWMRLFAQAYADIEPLKTTDYATWAKLEARIRLESISFRYVCEQLYDGYCIYQDSVGNTLNEDVLAFGLRVG